MDDDEDDDEPKVRRKQKKLKLILHPNSNSRNTASSASESNGFIPMNRNVDAVFKTEGKNSTWKTTEVPRETSDLGPTTPLPDKKLLDFILDKLQKKDTYGVFSEPVVPDELPDYHDIIKHPMDFGTVRKRISSGAYKYLEQFEGDVFLISSNGMRYNAPDTVYFRQARSIHELAKKSFENLRREAVGSGQQPKIVRRGRPPGSGKNNLKPPAGRSPAERTVSEFSSEALLANAVDGNHSSGLRSDLLRRGSALDLHGMSDATEAYMLGSERGLDRNEDFSGSLWKGFPNYGKKFSVVDESRRNTYKQYQPSSFAPLDDERKVLLQVGFHVEHAYAKSLARFAANLGPIAWAIAAKRIEKVLPSGIKFGPGWVGEEIDPPRRSHQPPFSNPSPHPSPVPSNVPTTSSQEHLAEMQAEIPSNDSPSAAAPEKLSDSGAAKASPGSHQKANISPHPGMFARPNSSTGNYGLEAVIARAHQWTTTVTPDGERVVEPAVSLASAANHGIHMPSSGEGTWNVRGVAVDLQKPDLALQL